ncbi:MAG: 3-methylornithine--L-lysine ligase PylC [Coriobacteriales bacterium]|jgi:pyrrolysine biosynthesis protein PylC|nr:3-methylornithine--L-lysine ligase PylC [Coriobacteriales bacterium]
MLATNATSASRAYDPAAASPPQALVVGGRLQGLELSWLARRAGYRVVVVDREEVVPAAGLADACVVADVEDADALVALVLKSDIVLPALEDATALALLQEYGASVGTDVVADLGAYAVSASKTASNELFGQLGLPMPRPWPQCGFPVIIKPDGLSGSQGVCRADSEAELREAAEFLGHAHQGAVVQEYLTGPSYSLEVIGNGWDYACLPVTEVCCADDHDCERIIAPAQLDAGLHGQFLHIAHSLAQRLRIDGIFDIEAIDHNGQLRLLEIDARFPSQTPISVYCATGVNMVELLAARHVPGALARAHVQAQEKEKAVDRDGRCCLYQQIAVCGSEVALVGEHALAHAVPLREHRGLFGADTVISDWAPGAESWKAIVIITANTIHDAWERYERCIQGIRIAQGTAPRCLPPRDKKVYYDALT